MVSRRIFFKSFGLATGLAVFSPFQLTQIQAKSTRFSFSKRQKVVLIGSSQQSELFSDYIRVHSHQFEIIAQVGAAAKQILSNTPQFSSLAQLKAAGLTGDLIFISGSAEPMRLIKEAVLSGYHVWVDRPVSYKPATVDKINAFAAGYFCKLNVMYVVEGNICLMPTKFVPV